MNEEELSDIMAKITSMMNNNNSNTSDDSNKFENSNKSTDYESSNNSFNIDIETMLKVKKAMDKMNNNQNNPRTNLLLSLKPYLKPSRKDKIDQYIQLLNMENMLEIFKSDGNNGGDNK